MKRNLILFAFLIHVSFAYSQKVDYRNYYKTINRAELKITDSLFNDAITIYDSAFSMVAKPFGKDYHNAALCATIAGKDDKAFAYLDKLMAKGLTMDYFKGDLYNPLQKSQQWPDFTRRYEANHEEIMKSFDLKLRKELETIQRKDQAMDMLRMSNIAENRDSFAICVFKNMERINEIITTKGFPCENLFGVILLPHANPVWMPFFHYILMKPLMVPETRQRLIDRGIAPTYNVEKAGIDYNKYDISAILMKASIEGKFPVHSFAAMEEQKLDPVKYGCRICIKIEDTAIYVNYSRSEAHKIDSIRMDIGLESLKDYRKKFDYFERLPNNDIRRKLYFDFQSAIRMYVYKNEQGKKIANRMMQGDNGLYMDNLDILKYLKE